MKGAKSVNLNENIFKSVEKLKKIGVIKTYSGLINEAIEEKIRATPKYYEQVKEILDKKGEE